MWSFVSWQLATVLLMSQANAQSLDLKLSIQPRVVDYGMPDHPNAKGRTQIGSLVQLDLEWAYSEKVKLSVGTIARVPFAHNFREELGAFPRLQLALQPFGPMLTLQIGSLQIKHGFHPAVFDERIGGYARYDQDLYNQTLSPAAQRILQPSEALPVENGLQLLADLGWVHAECFLDWQLLESLANREKFVVAALIAGGWSWLQLGLQYRLVHYGGELYSQTDPIRQAGLDPLRQPTTFAALATPVPIQFKNFELRLPLSFIHGRVPEPFTHAALRGYGLEVGVESTWYQVALVGYRLWLPQKPGQRLSDASDPIYSGPRSHHVLLGWVQNFDNVALKSQLDIIFPEATSTVQYQSSLIIAFDTSFALLRPTLP